MNPGLSLPLLLPLAAEAHGGGDPTGGLLSPEPGLFWWTVVTFLTVFLILKRFAWGPILDGLDAREHRIREDIERAEQARIEAERMLRDYQTQLDQARREAEAIIAEGREDGRRVREQLVAEGKAATAEEIERAKREIELARRKAVDDIRKEGVGLALRLAERLLERAIDRGEHEKLIESFLREIEASPAPAKAGAPRSGSGA